MRTSDDYDERVMRSGMSMIEVNSSDAAYLADLDLDRRLHASQVGQNVWGHLNAPERDPSELFDGGVIGEKLNARAVDGDASARQKTELQSP